MRVNGFEVDYILGDKLIVEFNGNHHYLINSSSKVLTARDEWKHRFLQERGFVVCDICSSEFQWLHHFHEKR